MNCCFCSQPVLLQQPITVSGLGPAHRPCYQQYLIDQRQFMGINLRTLSDTQLGELRELVVMEHNERQRSNADVELW